LTSLPALAAPTGSPPGAKIIPFKRPTDSVSSTDVANRGFRFVGVSDRSRKLVAQLLDTISHADPIMNRGPLGRWLGVVFTVLK
jgi:hypothetical protein